MTLVIHNPVELFTSNAQYKIPFFDQSAQVLFAFRGEGRLVVNGKFLLVDRFHFVIDSAGTLLLYRLQFVSVKYLQAANGSRVWQEKDCSEGLS